MTEEMSDAEYMRTIPDRIPDYGPNMSMHQCPRCDRFEPVSDRSRQTPLCRYCGVPMDFHEGADLKAQRDGFHIESKSKEESEYYC